MTRAGVVLTLLAAFPLSAAIAQVADPQPQAPVPKAQGATDRKQWLEADAAVAAAEPRVALIIGNTNYDGSNALMNPVNDAHSLANALQKMGFTVLLRLDRTNREMGGDLADFSDAIRARGPGTVALFYYSGHGAQVRGTNYLIPIGFALHTERDIEYDSLPTQRVLDEMQDAKCRMSVVILDACRNNPYLKTRSVGGRGLAKLDAPLGSFIAYATAPGHTASDNGLYAATLLESLQTPGLSIEQVFKKTRQVVIDKSNGEQVPWDESSLTVDFAFTRAAAPVALVPPPVATLPQSQSKQSAGAQYAARGNKALADKKWTDAETAYRLALETDPDSALYHNQLAVALDGEARYAEAEPHYRLAASAAPGDAVMQGNLGFCLYRQGKYADAIPLYREAIRLAPTTAMYRNWLGSILSLNGEFAEAEKEMREAVHLDPSGPNQFWLGRALYGETKYLEAEVPLREATRLTPTDPVVWDFLGNALRLETKFVEAEAAYQEAIRLAPNNKNYRNQLGVCLGSQLKQPEAEAQYREAIRLDPTFRMAYANLAGALVNQNRRAEATPYAKKALELGEPAKNHWVFKSLGLAP